MNLYYDYENDDIQCKNLDARSGHPVARARRSVRTATASRATRTSTSDVGGPLVQGQALGLLRVPEPAELGGGAAVGQHPRRHAVRHQAVQLHRQGHLSDEPEQQVHRLSAARHQAAAEPHRQQQPPRRAGSHPAATRRCCRTRRAGSTRASGTARSARTCSPNSAPGSSATTSASTATPTPPATSRSTTNEILGGGRDWLNCVGGATSTPARSATSKTTSLGGSHNFKFGGEYLDEKGNTSGTQAYADNVIHFLNGSLPGSALGDDAGGGSSRQQRSTAGARWRTTSFFVTDTWAIKRLTLNVGAAFRPLPRMAAGAVAPSRPVRAGRI